MLDVSKVQMYALGWFAPHRVALFDTLAEIVIVTEGVVAAEIWAGQLNERVLKGRAGRAVLGPSTEVTTVAVSSGVEGPPLGGVSVHFEAGTDRAMVSRLSDAVAGHLGELVEQWRARSQNLGLAVVDREANLLWANAQLGVMMGWAPSDVVGENVLTFIHPDDLASAAHSFERSSRFPGPKVPYDLRFRTGSDSWVALEVVADNRLDDASINGIIFSFRDPSDRVPADRQISFEAEVLAAIASGKDRSTIAALVFRMLTTSVPALGWSLSAPAAGTGPRLHRIASSALGPPFDAVADAPIGPAGTTTGACFHREEVVIAPSLDDPILDPIVRAALARTGSRAIWSVPVTGTGGVVLGVLDGYRHVAGQPTPDQSRTLDLAARLLALGLERDHTEQRRSHDARHDALTGLPNRLAFTESLEERVSSPDRDGTTVLFVDLDAFKQINDSLGYAVGDELLQAVAERIEACCDATAHPGALARFGGDEFTLLVPDASAARHLADEILRSFAAVFSVGGHKVYVTATIGMAVYDPEHSSTGAGLLSNADAAMYAAKRRTPRRIVTFEHEILADVNDRLLVTTNLRGAVDNGELIVHFQEIVDLGTGQAVAAEALVRWQHGQTLHPPSRFLGIAEDTGLIIPIGRQVLRDAARRASSRPDQITHVNLSPHQLLDDDLLPTIEGALAAYGVDPQRVGFEITEHAIIPDPAAAIAVLELISAAGHPLAIDDFGTGYASLAYLRDLPVDSLKIDRSFIARLHDDPRTRTIIAATIDLAHALGLIVVAEGIEQRRDADLITELGCDHGQGWFFHIPAP